MTDTGAPTGQEPNGATAQPGQEPAGSQGQQGQPGQEPAGQQQGDNDGTPDLSTITDPNLRAWVESQAKAAKDARQEAARYRTERNTYRETATAAQRANETAEQTAQRESQERDAEREALRAEVKSLKVGAAFNTAAAAAKALDPNGLLALIGGPDKVDLDDDGKPANLDTLIAQAKAQYPWAFSRVTADAGAGAGQAQGAGAGQDMNSFIRGRAVRAG